MESSISQSQVCELFFGLLECLIWSARKNLQTLGLKYSVFSQLIKKKPVNNLKQNFNFLACGIILRDYLVGQNFFFSFMVRKLQTFEKH